ncbi:hypothetical protein AB5J55_00055 [Streptomyces sp. R11]|uniref:Uncharacterized protein n=1 Tax=Streptomyces sp. R11 TaxID=3238625 RepID=A0AB39MQY2_9ACTN
MHRIYGNVMPLAIALGVCAAVLAPGEASAAAITAARSTALPISAPTTTSSVGPFTEPAFASTCAWHVFGEGEIPPWWLMFDDPLCVEYSKRDITVDNGGALRFLIAEPSRFALAMVTCRYYQKDRWSVQATTGSTPWVTWDGQYWWDKTRQQFGARLSNFRIHGTSVGIGDAVAALRPTFPDLADVLDDYGHTAGETGLTTTSVPFDLRCFLDG